MNFRLFLSNVSILIQLFENLILLFEVVFQDFQFLYLFFPELLDYIQSAYAIDQFQFQAVIVFGWIHSEIIGKLLNLKKFYGHFVERQK